MIHRSIEVENLKNHTHEIWEEREINFDEEIKNEIDDQKM